jgi:prevent-host-death family protein
MNPKTKSAARLRKELDETLRAAARGQAFLITQPGEEGLILVPRKEYERMAEECRVLREVSEGMADLAAGRVYSHEETLAYLEQRRLQWNSPGPRKRASDLRKSKPSLLKIHPPRRKRSLTG